MGVGAPPTAARGGRDARQLVVCGALRGVTLWSEGHEGRERVTEKGRNIISPPPPLRPFICSATCAHIPTDYPEYPKRRGPICPLDVQGPGGAGHLRAIWRLFAVPPLQCTLLIADVG